ncbi:MAG: hypothetical protein Q9172_005305, partial [Xanthocarpia lactea]
DGVKGAVKDVAETIGGPGRIMAAIQEQKKEGEKTMEDIKASSAPPAGGPLDQMAEGVVEKAKGGWGSWFGGR